MTDVVIDLEEKKGEEFEIEMLEITDYVSGISNKPKVNGVELVGNKTTKELGIDVDTSKLATKEEVLLKVDKSEIPTEVSELINDAGYLTEHQDISGKADKEDTYTKEEVDVLIPDVQVNGTSIVQDGVANVPVATSSTLGAVKVSPNQGISAFSAGDLCIVGANENEIKNKQQSYKPITPKNLDLAVKTSLTTNALELTDEEKQSTKDWLGIDGGKLPEIAVAGEGIKFEEEREENYVEYCYTGNKTEDFGFSEDGKYLTYVPQRCALKIDKADLNRDFSFSVRTKITNLSTSSATYILGLGTSSYGYVTVRKTGTSPNERLYASCYFGTSSTATVLFSNITGEEVDISAQVTYSTEEDFSYTWKVSNTDGTVLAEKSGTTSIYSKYNNNFLIGNRAVGTAHACDIDLTNTWVEQDGVRHVALKLYENPRTRIGIDKIGEFLKNKTTANYSLVTGVKETNGSGTYVTAISAEQVAAKGTAVGYNSSVEQEAVAYGYEASSSFGGAQLGQGYSYPFELGFGDYDVIDFSGKLFKDRLPLKAGNGITLTPTSGKRYRLIGDAKVTDGILTFGNKQTERSCLCSHWSGYNPNNFLEFQIALKDVPSGSSTYGSSEYLMRGFIRDSGETDDDGHVCFTSPYLYYNSATDSSSTRIYYRGFMLSGSIKVSAFDQGNILIKETINGELSPKKAALIYSTDDGATWTTITETEFDYVTRISPWTLLVGQPENTTYVTTNHFSGSVDLNKSFFYLGSSRSTNFLTYAAEVEANELIISTEGSGGSKASYDAGTETITL